MKNWQWTHTAMAGLLFSASAIPILGHAFGDGYFPWFAGAGAVCAFFGGLLGAMSESAKTVQP